MAHKLINSRSGSGKTNKGEALNGITPSSRIWCSPNVSNPKEKEEEMVQKVIGLFLLLNYKLSKLLHSTLVENYSKK